MSPGERLNNGVASLGIFLASFEYRFHHLQVWDQVDQRVAGYVLAGPFLFELALVSGE